MAVEDVRSDCDWSDAATSRSEMVSRCCSVSAPLFTQSTRLSKLETDLTFMILQALQFLVFLRSRLYWPDFGVVFARM